MTTGRPGRVMVYSQSGKVPKDLRETVDGRLTLVVIRDADRWQRTDFYVTRAALSAKIERAAATMHAQVVVWPEGDRWLLSRIDSRCFSGSDVWLYLPGQAGDAI